MSLNEICITGEDGDYTLIADTLKSYNGRIHKSLIIDNGLVVDDGKTHISDTLYQEWFSEDIIKAAQKEQSIDAKKFSNKYFVQFDYPLNKEGQGVSADFFSENEETAKAEALEVYKEQFGAEATGKIIKFIRYRWAKEVRQFCIEKYGTAYPRKIECGYITWTNVPFFAMPYSPMEMRGIPYLEDWDIGEHNEKIEAEMTAHMKKHPKPVRKLWKLPYYNEKKLKRFLGMSPGNKEIYESVKKWHDKYKTLDNSLRRGKSSLLTPEQLELLGINFDPYKHKYRGGKAYIEFKGKRMEIAPDIGKVL